MPAYMPAQKRQDIREAIQSGMTGADIMRLLTVSAGTVVKIKREMGLPIRPIRQTRTRGPVRAVAQVAPDTNISELAQQALARIRAEAPTAPPAPTAPASPEAYVEAFENRVLEYRTILAQKDGTIERLERELVKLRDEYAQTVFRQQNWQGPTSIMNQSLGNGE